MIEILSLLMLNNRCATQIMTTAEHTKSSMGSDRKVAIWSGCDRIVVPLQWLQGMTCSDDLTRHITNSLATHQSHVYFGRLMREHQSDRFYNYTSSYRVSGRHTSNIVGHEST